MLRLSSSAYGWISVHVENEVDGDTGWKYRPGLVLGTMEQEEDVVGVLVFV